MQAAVQDAPTIGIDIDLIEDDGDVLVTCGGEAGYEQVTALCSALFGIAARRPRRVRVDLTDVGFISSVAVGVLATFRLAVERHGGRVTFITASPTPPALR